MSTQPQTDERRWKTGLLIAALILTAGIIGTALIRSAGAPVAAGVAAAVLFNLASAWAMDRYTTRDFVLPAAMALMVALHALPLLWMDDPSAWIRSNPLTLGIILIVAAYRRKQYVRAWPLYFIAAVLGGGYVLMSVL